MGDSIATGVVRHSEQNLELM